MAKEDVEKEVTLQEQYEEFELKVKNLDGEILYEETELDFCDIEIGAMMDDKGKLKSKQLYYIIQAGDYMNEDGDTFEFEIYAPVESCVIVKQKTISRKDV